MQPSGSGNTVQEQPVASGEERPTTRTGIDTYTPLVSGQMDPEKAEYSTQIVTSPYDPAKDDPLKDGEELVPGDNGQQMVRRTIRTREKAAVSVGDIDLRPVDVSDSEKWLVGKVGLMNGTRALSITDVQISFVHGDLRTVILGGKATDPTNPLRNGPMTPGNGQAILVSSPVKYESTPGHALSLEVEVILDGPPGLITMVRGLEGIRIDPNTGNRMR